MKKMLLTGLVCAAAAAGASADALRIEAGAGAWMQTPTGSVSYTTSDQSGSDSSTEQENTVGYAWIYLKHPIPIIPDIRLEYTRLEYEGDVAVTLGTGSATASTTSTSTFDTDVYDAILYYNLLDNLAWTTLDLGLDVRMFDYSYDVAPTNDGFVDYGGYSKSGTLVVPLAYLRARFDVPGTGIGFEGEGSFVGYDGDSFYDVRVKADWTMDFVPVVQPGIEVGYRVLKVDYGNSSDDLAADVEFSGVYAGLMLRF